MRLSDQQFLYNKVKKASMNHAGPDAKKFKKIEELNPQEENEEYKPQLLNPTDVQVDMENSAGRADEKSKFAINSARSNDDLVPEENNKIGNTKSMNITNKRHGKTDEEDLLNNEAMDNMINPIIFIRGVACDSFYLVLSGKVMICSGNEGFFLEQGPFNYMGIDCLINDNYVPDFSAKILGKTKLLKITREEYRKALGHIGN